VDSAELRHDSARRRRQSANRLRIRGPTGLAAARHGRWGDICLAVGAEAVVLGLELAAFATTFGAPDSEEEAVNLVDLPEDVLPPQWFAQIQVDPQFLGQIELMEVGRIRREASRAAEHET
jgi:hypothetical protein